ncbi:sigma-70 family RNA polymerase sigma factor [Rhizobium binae]|uniref:RNA polymerase sigma factor n=1 Tax=Rhizobium binae TaxID=1138190 RepID=A0ABV2MK78_9HYPH|nr:sigma-70 family RNA polymerase sigma factor [Rhizobium binae]NKL51575.1 sigma-70 family RNA polymerase sigma factor [Rhizobium leguminosarum bv. viciae]MBX4928141.1 sigma-70 family RNA polymerase sigma factor [Rhizobium binae]MBX4938201.1 sigma-70 family RNA polymerase sigma factor [Rhizobium binae]MBX4944707.1 sigma-70 family RNA polymerase sigma factor [Rhizobium binae]MBX4951846.1 sigma-70 family RNA polymerase sigma factor [Rhizobium binae]
MMTDARITYSIASEWLPLAWHHRKDRIQPSPLIMLLDSAARLFHLMVSDKASDKRGVSAADATAQHELMHRFQSVIIPHLDAAYNFARFLSRDADAAQDIVQDAFLRAFRNFESYRGGDPRAWLFAIVRNCCHVWRQQDRRKARFEQHLSDGGDNESEECEIATEEDSPETATIRRSEQQGVRTVISKLPEAIREILVLRELEDLSYRQIAEVIDAPIGTVMSRLARARHEFGEAWDAYQKRGGR